MYHSSLFFTLFACFALHNHTILAMSLTSSSLVALRHIVRNPRIHLGGSRRARTTAGSACRLFSATSNEDDEDFSKTYQLTGVGRQSKVEIRTNTGHQLQTDVPKKMGGGDTAPQPVETLLAAWMGCTQATALFVGRQMSPRILIESLEFHDIEAVRDERGALSLPIDETPTIPSRLHRVTGIIRVLTRNNKKPMSVEQMELLKEQTEIRCPIANMMIASGCSMEVDWVDATATTTSVEE